MSKTILPGTDESGYYEIRMESIGGLGANLAGKMLAQLGALYMGLNASSFSSYGSEKKGSPVRAFVRYMEKEGCILRSSPVYRPHLLVIFHEALIGKYPVFDGVSDRTTVVINTAERPESYRKRHQELSDCRIFCLDASGLAAQCSCRLNMVMMGAAAAASGFLDTEKLMELYRASIGERFPDQLAKNLQGLKKGYEAVREAVPDSFTDSGQVSYGVQGGINPFPGNTAVNDLSASREGFIPLFHPEKCIHCGLCDSTCPDMVFQFSETVENGKLTLHNEGPDYQYCKGCLRCVQICPVQALTTAQEGSDRQ